MMRMIALLKQTLETITGSLNNEYFHTYGRSVMGMGNRGVGKAGVSQRIYLNMNIYLFVKHDIQFVLAFFVVVVLHMYGRY